MERQRKYGNPPYTCETSGSRDAGLHFCIGILSDVCRIMGFTVFLA
jgi:hypothetical protein